MPWINTTASNYKDCLDKVRQFSQKAFKAGTVTHVTGSVGSLRGASATHNSVAETWTVTCTTGGGDGTAVFSVSGGTSGSKASATAGVPYSISEVSFILSADGGSFSVSDQFTFPVAASTAEWVQDRWDTDYDGNGGYELIQHGIGSGSDAIYVGYNTKTDDSTYWNWLASGLSGYNALNDMTAQPGYHPFYDCMNNASFPFTCIFTSRHIKVIPTTVTGEQGGTYNGWFLPHATPSQWEYPMFCGGSTDTSSETPGSLFDRHTCYWNAYSDEESGAILDSTVWYDIGKLSPRNFCGGNSGQNYFSHFRPFQNGNIPLFPAIPVNDSTKKGYGDLEGVYYPSAYVTGTGLLSAGDVIISPDKACLCFKDVFRGSAGNVIAMDLMGD
jgi:hypothetical protein